MVSKMGSIQEVKSTLRLVFQHAVNSVNPRNLIRNRVQFNNDILSVGGKKYKLNENCYLVGFGKAVLGMAVQSELMLGKHLKSGILSIPIGQKKRFSDLTFKDNSSIVVYEGAKNNIPDEDAEKAAKQIEALARNLKTGDLLLVLISGGGSALLPLPVPPITLQEKASVVKLLSKSGADITELNLVRKRLSLLKGGGLLNVAYPAEVVALVLSDIVGDPLDFIASGPTVINEDEPDKPKEIMQKYSLLDKIPNSVKSVLDSPPKLLNQDVKVHNFVIGSNSIALESALEGIVQHNYEGIILSSTVEGLVSELYKSYINLIIHTCRVLLNKISQQDFHNQLSQVKLDLKIPDETFGNLYKLISKLTKRKICFLLGGEPTVKVTATGDGKGGRSQQLALLLSDALQKAYEENPWLNEFNVCCLCAGTDGLDGPTDAAGAITYNGQMKAAIQENLNPTDYIANYDSYTFFSEFSDGEDLIKIGHTGTNVMDIHLFAIELRNKMVP